MRRVLRPGGFVVIIEPWLTFFLRLVHILCASHFARARWAKLEALAAMIDNERMTYDQWLNNPAKIRQLLQDSFERTKITIGWGKIICLGFMSA